MIELAILFALFIGFMIVVSIVLSVVGVAFKITLGLAKLILLPFVLVAGLFVCLAIAPVFVGLLGALVVFLAIAVPVLVIGAIVWLGAHLLAPVA